MNAAGQNRVYGPDPITEPSVRFLLYAYSLVLFSIIVVHVAFTNRTTWGDEDGLYNPIYMYQHYGKVTYPMQLQFEYMTIHPPTHYFIVGLLTKVGLQVFHAAAVPLVLLALLAFGAVLTSRFMLPAKFSLLTGFTLATLVYTPLVTIRPDMHVAFAWFSGMVFLEASRSLGWESRRLFLGCFFIAYASGIHYWAGAAVLVLPAYFIYILVRPAGASRWAKLAVMVCGALLFYIPYAIFFVIPQFQPIMQMLRGANATGGGVRASMSSQWEQLTGWTNTAWPLEFPALGKWIFFPVSGLRIPPIALAVPVLLATKSLRGLALPGAILPLFVFTMVSRKGGLFYIAPELTLYAVAVSLVFYFIVNLAYKIIRLRGTRVPCATAMILAVLVLARSAPAAKYGMAWKIVDWDVARAANIRLLGKNALVAINQCYDWYTCGGRRLYWIVTHIGWEFMERVNRDRQFDSVAVLSDWFANGRETIPFPEFYMNGNLNLRGFYFPGRYKTPPKGAFDQILPLLHLTARKDIRQEGFGYDRERGKLNYYVAAPNGPWVFVTFKAFLNYPDEWPTRAVYLVRFDMQRPLGKEPGLFAMVTTRAQWLQDRGRYAALGTIRDEISMNMTEIPVERLLRDRDNERIDFETNQADVR
jgi:hypothetical protein